MLEWAGRKGTTRHEVTLSIGVIGSSDLSDQPAGTLQTLTFTSRCTSRRESSPRWACRSIHAVSETGPLRSDGPAARREPSRLLLFLQLSETRPAEKRGLKDGTDTEVAAARLHVQINGFRLMTFRDGNTQPYYRTSLSASKQRLFLSAPPSPSQVR